MSNQWIGIGPRYGLDWGGRAFELAVDGPRPGLIARDEVGGVLLGLEGVAATGRDGAGVLSGSSLVHHEIRLGRVEAVYAPEGWGSLRVRAGWIPRGQGILDLEVQLQAHSVGELESVEVWVTSDLASSVEAIGGQGVEPLAARMADRAGGLHHYLEMVHPDDAARRVVETGAAGFRVRYGLFGYDLERGVVLRGRLRGIWLPERPDVAEVARRLEAFLAEPLPLGI
jgi:hypothetical protein